MKSVKILLVGVFSVTLLSSFVSCKKEKEISVPESERICLVDDKVKDYILNGTNISTYKDQKADYSKEHTINLSNDENKEYTFDLSLDSKFENMISKKTKNVVHISNLQVDSKYYWRATDGTNNLEGTFVTQSYAPRYMNVEGVNNVRDIGGWKINKSKIAQGLVFRGSEMNKNYNITEDGIKVMKESMKIKTDLDLRTNAEANNITKSPLGDDINYVHIPTFKGYIAVNNEGQFENYKKIFKLLADSNSYPIYFHCYQGADRTGTIADLIEGLMGVSDEDRIKDYELTSFSSGVDAYRDVSMSSCQYKFIKMNISAIEKASTYQKSIEMYLKDKLSLEDSEIKSIKDILSGKVNVNKADIALIK